MSKWLAAVEIGGSKLQVALGRAAGELVHVERTQVQRGWDASEIRDRIAALLSRALAVQDLRPSDVEAVGVGFGGPVDADRGLTLKSHHVPGWDQYPLAEWFRDLWGWPAAIQNDADTAGLGEALYGAGRDRDPIFYITVGTGIGGGLIVHRKIYRGAGLGAGEIGHLRIMPKVEGQPGGPWYITEELASGSGLAARAQELVAAEPGKGAPLVALAGGDPRDITAVTVAEAARRGDELAQRLVSQAIEALARAICHVVALVCPARFVIGGGVSEMGETLFFEPLRRRVAELVFPPFRNSFDIVPAALGKEVVLYGALELARAAAAGQSPTL